jgi:hypothetical protein
LLTAPELSLSPKPPLIESEGGNRERERIREIYIDRERDKER